MSIYVPLSLVLPHLMWTFVFLTSLLLSDGVLLLQRGVQTH